MRFQGAVIREQGVTFALVVVTRSAIDGGHRESVLGTASRLFPGLPVVLVAQDGSGRARYYGRKDIAAYMARVPLEAVPWRWYTAA